MTDMQTFEIRVEFYDFWLDEPKEVSLQRYRENR